MNFDLADVRAFADHYSHVHGLSSAPLTLERDAPVLTYQPEARDRRPPAPSRDPCPRCEIRGDLGCRHQAPFDPPPTHPFRPNDRRPSHIFTRPESGTAMARTKYPARRIDDATGLEREMIVFCNRHHLSQSAFAAQIGQSSNWNTGVFAKAREGRLKPATEAKIMAFMAGFGCAR